MVTARTTIRNPYPQAGYFVAFVPFEDGKQSDEWEVFANGFAGGDPIVNTSEAEHHPAGLATGPDGSLYVTEDNDGTIWRVIFTGDRGDFGESNLAKMEKLKRTASNICTPDKKADILEAATLEAEEVAKVATYIRQNLGNSASAVDTGEVREVRKLLSDDPDS